MKEDDKMSWLDGAPAPDYSFHKDDQPLIDAIITYLASDMNLERPKVEACSELVMVLHMIVNDGPEWKLQLKHQKQEFFDNIYWTFACEWDCSLVGWITGEW